MDKLSDFLPLLLIVGSVVISIVQSSNKKKKAEQAKKEAMVPKGATTKRPLGVPVVSLPKMRSIPLVQDRMEREELASTIFNPEVNRSVQTISKEEDVLDEVAEVNSFIFDTASTDELKKAVIYSEILNKKEY